MSISIASTASSNRTGVSQHAGRVLYTILGTESVVCHTEQESKMPPGNPLLLSHSCAHLLPVLHFKHVMSPDLQSSCSQALRALRVAAQQ